MYVVTIFIDKLISIKAKMSGITLSRIYMDLIPINNPLKILYINKLNIYGKKDFISQLDIFI